MAGTATNYDETTIRCGKVGQLWANVAVPGAGLRLTLDADGTPDSTANPTAVHLGMTSAGSTITIGTTTTDLFADEFQAPVCQVVEQTTFTIEAGLLQIHDADVLKIITAPFGTFGSAAGYEEFTIGRKALVYTSIALIWEWATGKFAVAQMYKGINTNGLTFTVDRKGRSETPTTFTASEITTRAAADTLGNYWKELT